MATIKEIAAFAGVSRGTVDRVLNNRGGVSQKTADKIRRIMEEQNFQPNLAGMALATQARRKRVGVILYAHDTNFYNEIEKGIIYQSRTFAVYGLEPIIHRVNYDEDSFIDALDQLEEVGISGLIISTYDSDLILARLKQLINQDIPVLTVNSDCEKIDRFAFVGCDAAASGRTAAAMIELLRRSEAYVGVLYGNQAVPVHRIRMEALKQCVTEEHPHIHLVERMETLDDDILSYKATLDLLKRHLEINTIYVAAGGQDGVCQAIADTGHPEDYIVITGTVLGRGSEWLKAGVINAVLSEHPLQQGMHSLDLMARKILCAELPFLELNYTETSIILPENVPHQYLNQYQ